ncbi:MAG: helix-hairpin-helix domain-containing protein [Anaeroplasmataceae bacterium]|nr:helix-hairpin-helix domain-containing protein [Anaeroplasmataceae bacterium]
MKRKALYFIAVLIFVLSLLGFIFVRSRNDIDQTEEPTYITPSLIAIDITGEVSKDCKLLFTKNVTYGMVFIQIQTILNLYSDLSGFDHLKPIVESVCITIPTLDENNEFDEKNMTETNKININTANKKELLKLKQIGEKRAQKILDYILQYGSITSWELFWRITDVPQSAKVYIQQQAFL